MHLSARNTTLPGSESSGRSGNMKRLLDDGKLGRKGWPMLPPARTGPEHIKVSMKAGWFTLLDVGMCDERLPP